MEYPIWVYIVVSLVMIASSIGATYLVSFFGGHRDVKSIITASVLLLLLNGGLSLLNIGGIAGWGIGGIVSIIIFVKTLDFEPMGALFAGVLFSFFFTIISVSIMSLFFVA